MYMCLSPSPFQKDDFTSGSDNQAFILAQLIVYLNCNFSFFLTTFKSVDAAEIWLVTVSNEFIHIYLHFCKETPFSGRLLSLTEFESFPKHLQPTSSSPSYQKQIST